jgi:hypothetical protein
MSVLLPTLPRLKEDLSSLARSSLEEYSNFHEADRHNFIFLFVSGEWLDISGPFLLYLRVVANAGNTRYTYWTPYFQHTGGISL